MQQSAEEYSLDELTAAPHGSAATAGRLADIEQSAASRWQPEDIQGICANPLRDEPHPVTVAAVRRFGVVGLVLCALGAGLLRWCRSLGR